MFLNILLFLWLRLSIRINWPLRYTMLIRWFVTMWHSLLNCELIKSWYDSFELSCWTNNSTYYLINSDTLIIGWTSNLRRIRVVIEVHIVIDIEIINDTIRIWLVFSSSRDVLIETVRRINRLILYYDKNNLVT